MPLTGHTIVVTDDEPDQRDFIVTVLEDAGATVVKAHNGNEALELTESTRPDAITLDISMPGLDAFHIVDALQNNGFRKDLRICIVSGRPELRRLLIDKFGGGRPMGFVDKPFVKDELIGKIQELLGT